MPTDCPHDNSRYCKEYRERIKQDPVKQQALREKKSQAQKLRRARQRELAEPVASACRLTEPVASEPGPTVASPVTSGSQEAEPVASVASLGGKHSAPPTGYWAEGMTQEQIIDEYREHHAKQEPSDTLKDFIALLDQ